MIYSKESGIRLMNKLGAKKEPFLFVLSYDKSNLFVKSLDDLEDIYFKLEERRNYRPKKLQKSYMFEKYPVDFKSYSDALLRVKQRIEAGDTYLLNLTFQTPIKTDLDIGEIFAYSKAKFKLNFKNNFVCFSPEKFIYIDDDTISTYPMKGTIDANLPNAKDLILHNEKEMAEHVMIVDLMRNDLGVVADRVKVDKFRYVQKIMAGEKELLQVSSKISASLTSDWQKSIGSIIDLVTPAGSITGTPKKSTVKIIDEIEGYNRGFYTGVFGLFDGNSVKSAVMIRFVQKINGKLYYKSGGGITIDSDANSEYQELIDKIYLPI